MDKITKVYIDSRYKTNDSVSNSDFKFELKEGLDLPDATFCYIDDIAIPHSWFSIEHYNNTLYVENTYPDFSLSASVLTLPEGNYNATSLATTLAATLQHSFPNENYRCVYNTARGSITITSDRSFRIYTDQEVIDINNNLIGDPSFPGWVDNNNQLTTVDINNLRSMNETLRHSSPIAPDATFETGFIDLLNVHNIYIHSSLGNYNSVGVRGENTIIKKVSVSSSFGYLILDNVVAPHDKIDVSRLNLKTIHFSLKNVHGNVINLHGAHISLSLIFQTID